MVIKVDFLFLILWRNERWIDMIYFRCKFFYSWSNPKLLLMSVKCYVTWYSKYTCIIKFFNNCIYILYYFKFFMLIDVSLLVTVYNLWEIGHIIFCPKLIIRGIWTRDKYNPYVTYFLQTTLMKYASEWWRV